MHGKATSPSRGPMGMFPCISCILRHIWVTYLSQTLINDVRITSKMIYLHLWSYFTKQPVQLVWQPTDFSWQSWSGRHRFQSPHFVALFLANSLIKVYLWGRWLIHQRAIYLLNSIIHSLYNCTQVAVLHSKKIYLTHA